jgi:amino acid transporter
LTQLLEIITTTGSIGGVLVWASQCLAFIRYFNWFRLHKEDLERLRRDDPSRYARYDRWDVNNRSRYISLLSPMQPFPAYLGLLNCFLIVFVFSTATWWNGVVTTQKVAVAFAGVSLDLDISDRFVLLTAP